MRKLLVFILPIALILSVCCKQKSEIHKIRVATLKGPSAMGMVKMIDSLNQTENASLEISIYNEPIQIRKLMLEGEVDFAILPTTMAAILYNKNVPYQIAAIPVWGTLYLVGDDLSIKSWSDLKGKKINLMAKGMTPDVLFRLLLIKNNVNPDKDVVLDYSFPTHIDLANAVASGQVKLGVISEPLVSLVLQKNKETVPIFDLNTEWEKVSNNIPFAQTALMVKTGFQKKEPKILSDFMDDYRKSTDWVNENKDLAAELIVKYGILPNTEVARSSIPRSNLYFIEAKGIKKEIIEYLKVFYTMNPDIIGGKVPDDNFFLY